MAAEILSGVTLATFAGAGVFFLKFWLASRDRFFLFISFSCALLAFERFMTLFIADVFNPIRGVQSPGNWIYALRVIAFLLIIAGIVEKNRNRT